jgi:hypothetical protein
LSEVTGLTWANLGRRPSCTDGSRTRWRGNLEVIEQGSESKFKIKAISRLWLSRLLVCFGLAVGTLSVWDTLSHTWDPAFQAPALPLGPTHTKYHAFREFTLSVGAMLVLAYGMFLPLAKRSRDLWNVMCVTAFFYYGSLGSRPEVPSD